MPRRNTFIPPQQKRPAMQPIRDYAAGRKCPKPYRAKFSPISHRDRQMMSIAASTRESRRRAPDERATTQLFSAIVLITAQKTRLLTAVAQASTIVQPRRQRTGLPFFIKSSFRFGRGKRLPCAPRKGPESERETVTSTTLSFSAARYPEGCSAKNSVDPLSSWCITKQRTVSGVERLMGKNPGY